MLLGYKSGMSIDLLPYDAEVEYLESTGTQWIDTGEKIYDDTAVTVTMYSDYSTENATYFFGSDSSTERFYFREYQGKASFSTGGWWQNTNIDFVGTHTVTMTNNSITVDGVSSSRTGASKTGAGKLQLFKSGTYAMTASGVRIYSCHIYQNGVLVRDFIPVRKGNVGYLYDRVSGKLFGNAGTGDFVLGPDVVPVEWLEGTGTQYIDTGIGYYADFEIKVKMRTSLSNITLYSGGYNRLERISGALPYWRFRSNAGGTYDSTIPITELHTLAWRNGKIYSDGAEVYQLSKPYQNNEMYVFGNSVTAFPCVIYYLDLWDSNNTPVRSFRPVRVGTGSTWEGAMMDVLTRRIYRNAGTGAFGYGDDLRYPITAWARILA